MAVWLGSGVCKWITNEQGGVGCYLQWFNEKENHQVIWQSGEYNLTEKYNYLKGQPGCVPPYAGFHLNKRMHADEAKGKLQFCVVC